jgi:hypothetical protein
MDAVTQAMATLDQHKHDMPEGVYLKLCDAMMAVHNQVTTQPRANFSQPTVQDVAPWSVPERPGRYTYLVRVPASVRVTTDVDLRAVPFFSFRRGLWYHNSVDGEGSPLPMTLEMVDFEPEVGAPSSFGMYDNVTNEYLLEDSENDGIDYGDLLTGDWLREVVNDAETNRAG